MNFFWVNGAVGDVLLARAELNENPNRIFDNSVFFPANYDILNIGLPSRAKDFR